MLRVLDNGFTVKAVGLECINSLANLHKASFQRGWGAHDFALFLQDRHMKLLGVFPNRGREPAGFLLIRCVADEAEVISIAVARRHRRKGLGEGLMQMAIDLLYDEGIKVLLLEVDETNKAAIELYNQLGFELVGERRAYYPAKGGEKAANALMMRLSLDDEYV